MRLIHHSMGNAEHDVELNFLGDRFPVKAHPTLRASGWRGGLWVMYVTAPTNEEFMVVQSDGTACAGFLLFPSENYAPVPPLGTGVGSSENYIGIQPAANPNNAITMVNGGTRAYFKVFETVALNGGTRTGGAITYSLNEEVKVSENGLLCNDSDVQFGLVGIASPIVIGIVSAIPSPANGNRLCVDIKY